MGGMTGLLFVLWVGVTVSTAVDLQKRIIGGKECDKKDRLYHVRLEATLIEKNEVKTKLCGGSLISDRWILTAAHCWEKGWTIKAILGVHPGTSVKTVQITEQPVIFEDANGKHDIMLLQLPETTAIKPIELPTDCKDWPKMSIEKSLVGGVSVQIAGHASTTMGPNNARIRGESPTLQCANIPVVDCAGLRAIVTIISPKRLYQHWFCGQSPRVDACCGDSGGGVVFKNKIYGVISFTGDPNRALTEAVGFMDVCKYLLWIQQSIR